MRRTPLALAAAAAALALMLGGCAAGNSDGGGDQPSGGAGTAFPAKIATKFGTVTVKEAPKRVVALGWGDAEAALAFGVQPVGASDWLGFGGDGVGPWAKGLYDTKPTIIGTLEPDYEKIAALKPDLILDTKSSGDQKRYQRLSSIATTVGIPKDGLNYLTSTTEQTTMVGEALGKPDEAKKLLAQVDDAVTAVADAHPQWKGKTTTVAAYSSNGWGAYVKGDTRVDFLLRLGFVQSPTIAELPVDRFSAPVSSERLDLLDADLLVAFPIFVPVTEVTDQPLWAKIPAVEEGHAILLDSQGADQNISQAFSLGSVLSQKYLVKEFPPLIEKAEG